MDGLMKNWKVIQHMYKKCKLALRCPACLYIGPVLPDWWENGRAPFHGRGQVDTPLGS